MKNAIANIGVIRGTINTLIMLGKKIKDLFRLEEVEVNFNENDKKAGYTYKKISHK